MWKPIGDPRILSALLLILLTVPPSYARSIRNVEVDDGTVIAVRTSLGYSTILEFPSRPLSAVLGDQDSFKVEYVGKSLTIKPLFPRAKSNLFVFTEYDRFNCELRTVSPDQLDYIVRIRAKETPYPLTKSPSEAPSARRASAYPGRVTRINRSSTYNGFRLKVKQVTRQGAPPTSRLVTLIDFELESTRRSYDFQPVALGVKQNGSYLTLESLYLDALQLGPHYPAVRGKIALLSDDFEWAKPVVMVFAVPDAHNPKKFHRIEVTATPLTKSTKPKENGGDPWEQEKLSSSRNPASTNTSSPKPIPSPSAEPSKLDEFLPQPSSL